MVGRGLAHRGFSLILFFLNLLGGPQSVLGATLGLGVWTHNDGVNAFVAFAAGAAVWWICERRVPSALLCCLIVGIVVTAGIVPFALNAAATQLISGR